MNSTILDSLTTRAIKWSIDDQKQTIWLSLNSYTKHYWTYMGFSTTAFIPALKSWLDNFDPQKEVEAWDYDVLFGPADPQELIADVFEIHDVLYELYHTLND